MEFYDMLSRYYDSIFPFSEETYHFLKSHIEMDNATVLDIGSATGSYVKQFNSDGIKAFGIDLSDFGKTYPFVKGSMSALPFKNESFDIIYSIGNTLVHAKSRKEFAQIMEDAFFLLKPKGRLILQILNYDRILNNNIKKLPDITTEECTFERYYEYENQGKITFKGVLTVNDSKYSSTVELIPVTFDEVKWVADKVKAHFVRFYGDFSGSKFFKNDSIMLIAVFYKQ